MNVHRGVVTSVADLTKSGGFKAKLATPQEPVHVTYVSPVNSINGGFFAVPSENSPILVLEIGSTDGGGNSGGYYYLGTIVGASYGEASLIDNPEGYDLFRDPQSAENITTPGDAINYKSLGLDVAAPPTAPLAIADRIYSNEVTPEIMAFLGKGSGGLLTFEEKVGGDGAGSAWINSKTRIQSGDGKRIDLVATPAQDFIKITTGKGSQEGGEDFILLGGKQRAFGAESNNVQAGEFRVDSHGPTNITSRDRGIEIRARGLNLDIINDSDGLFAPDSDGRYLIYPGGFPDAAPLYPPLPKPSVVSAPTGNAHPFGKGGPPGAKPDGGNPLDKGNEKYGNVNIRSEWNNINIEGRGPDSVIHLNAPYYEGKIVITTGGTVDIIATQKVSITSGESIELNAPYIDINSGIRTDID